MLVFLSIIAILIGGLLAMMAMVMVCNFMTEFDIQFDIIGAIVLFMSISAILVIGVVPYVLLNFLTRL